MSVASVFELSSFGVRLRIDIPDSMLAEAVSAVLPPGGPPAAGQPVHAHFALALDDDVVALSRDGQPVGQPTEPEVAVRLLEARMAAVVAAAAPDRMFVGAGVVVCDDRALVLPGRSLSGRTTLVNALAAAGADVYSDTFAVFDAYGNVRPYRRGGDDGRGPVRVAVIAAAPFRPGASWAPTRLGSADGALALLAVAAGGGDPARMLEVLGRVARGAMVLDGERGEATQAAPALLEALAAR